MGWGNGKRGERGMGYSLDILVEKCSMLRKSLQLPVSRPSFVNILYDFRSDAKSNPFLVQPSKTEVPYGTSSQFRPKSEIQLQTEAARKPTKKSTIEFNVSVVNPSKDTVLNDLLLNSFTLLARNHYKTDSIHVLQITCTLHPTLRRKAYHIKPC